MAVSLKSKSETGGYQFGWFKGVYTPSVLTVLGVIMYLRLGWVLGNAGLWSTLLIITISSAITFLTGLSLSALATNMKVGGGGAYYIISRSLGVEVGAAVGLPLYFAQALGISFYVAGFSEAFVSAFQGLNPTVVGVVTLLILAAVSYKSADLALKSQFLVMALIGVSLAVFFSGRGAAEVPVIDPSTLPDRAGFWRVFAVFFPAVTGIEAGIAMSGDLKDPAHALPRGTMAAVGTGYLVYMAIPLYLTFILSQAEIDALRHPSMNGVIMLLARWEKPVLLGVWAASLSSAMGALLGAPRTLQALARDRVIPRIFGRGFGKGNDPRIATLTSFGVGLVGVLLGDLNVIAPVLSMFFLTSYGLLNISAGLEELTAPPSWRPKFRVPFIFSFVGAFGCVAAMLMINAGATFVAAFVAIGVYLFMERRSLKAWWGDMRRGILMRVARAVVLRLAQREPDERTWQPNILVLSGAPTSRWYLIELASAISEERGFMTVASVVPPHTRPERVEGLENTITEYLRKRNVESLVKIYPAENALVGARTLCTSYGYGPIVPNTVLLGETENPEHYLDYAELILATDRMRQNLVIVREPSDQQYKQKEARIDLWWTGVQKNLGLMLALIHLLRRHSEWRHLDLRIKTVVDRPEAIEDTRNRLSQFIKDVRIDAQAEVLVRSSNDVFASIREHSKGADLVLIGMRAPHDEETAAEYSEYYKDLIARTQGMPPTALVSASEKIDFYSIFQQSE